MFDRARHADDETARVPTRVSAVRHPVQAPDHLDDGGRLTFGGGHNDCLGKEDKAKICLLHCDPEAPSLGGPEGAVL